jgi:hypothetical protein
MYEEQMQIIRENNKIKYENKMMRDCDEQSSKVQELFRQEGIKRKEERERQKRQEREREKRQERERQYHEEDRLEYLNYTFTRLSMSNGAKTFEEIYNESIELYHERCLKRQQDLEYDEAIMKDMERFK